MLRRGGESRDWQTSACAPDLLYACIQQSREKIMGKDSSDALFLWQVHHFNKGVTPLEVSLQGVARAQKEGLVRHVGLCNVSVDDIVAARKVVDIVSVQNKFSLWEREAETKGVLEYCAREGIAFMPHGALGGLNARRGTRNLERSFPRLKAVAEKKGCSTHAAALALMRHKWPNIIHITGARREDHVRDVASARHVHFSQSEVDELWSLKAARGSPK